MFEILSGLLAAVILLSVAFPEWFIPNHKKKQQVGSAYWGVYDGVTRETLPDEPKVEVQTPMRRFHPVAGSALYNGGHGRGRR